ncbi:calcium-translocating P-type ATPase [Auriculariales sp. MPI-PUGE-AT-0066]|nr:calcium-translocating P-type ATPase [Auriculariales sp. MPI-PUGE-AT-0066]
MASSSDKPQIPDINIVTSPAADGQDGAATAPDGDHYLSPTTHNPQTSSTTTASSAPPSPTSSTRSVHFPTSLALRDNGNPNATQGVGSLGLLDTNANSAQHGRKSSVATLTSIDGSAEGTEPDPHGSLSVPSTATHLARPSSDDGHSETTKVAVKGDGDKPANEEGSDSAPLAHIDPDEDTTNPTPFTHKPLLLASLFDPKNLNGLSELGGTDAVAQTLGTDLKKGLSDTSLDASKPEGGSSPESASLADRKRVYGSNELPSRPGKSLLLLMWLALKDRTLVLLSFAAVISLALGLYEDLGQAAKTFPCGDGKMCAEPKVDWVEGLAIIVAIVIVVLVGSLNDWQKERQFKVLNEKKEDRKIKVIRHGVEQQINVKDVVVGDIAVLEPGEIVPVDGLFIQGHNVECDESSATGETHSIKKVPYSVCIEKGSDKVDCFMISGAKVLEGSGTYVVVAVGTRSSYGRLMMALQGDPEATPLQAKLNDLAELIAKLGAAAGLVLFTALMIKFFVQLKTKASRTATEKANSFVDILIISVTLIVVAVPEGLPLAVTLALAFATKRMTSQNLLVRVLRSCEIMANASVICTDKTGTLTQNLMTVVAGSVGIHAKFVRGLEENKSRTNAGDVKQDPEVEKVAEGGAEGGAPNITVSPAADEGSTRKHKDDFSLDQADMDKSLPPSVRKLFNEAICINSTAFEETDPETGEIDFIGSKTEAALLRFAKGLGWADYRQVREAAQVMHMVPFSSERKSMGVVVKMPNGRFRFYVKGASEILTKLCKDHVVVNRPGEQQNQDEESVQVTDIDELSRDNISRTIIFYANQTLRTIALCYKDFEQWPIAGLDPEAGQDPYSALAKDLTLIGITGIEDPLRPGVSGAVAQCAKAGVGIKMCTGDNVLTARSIATQCGIFTPGGIIMEGPVFRELSEPEMDEIIPRLQVLARSSPNDKKILVERLKALGEIVAVTGDGTNDGPALKTANVGFSMGIAGTEIAKEASDIILMDDNFVSIVVAIMWGRCVNDAVRKFLQFQVGINITAVVTTIVTAVASDEEASVLSAVQLLWVNIIMDTFAALALATDPATPQLLDRKPERSNAPLFTIPMSKQIVGQSIFSTALVLVLHFAGDAIFGYGKSDNEETRRHDKEVLRTLVFNAFVFAQIFNSINCRRLDNRFNILEGILLNWYFIIITIVEIGIQILIVFVGGAAFQVTKMPAREWAVSIIVGLLALVVGAFMRLLPDSWFEWLWVKLRIMRDPKELPSVNWNPALDRIRENLTTFQNIRGGRMRGSNLVMKSKSSQLEKNDIQLPTLLMMVPTIIATSVGAGWTPRPGGSLSDPTSQDPSHSSAALWEGKVQFHPETPTSDATMAKWREKAASNRR